MTNDAQEGIYLRTWTRSENTNVGQNKIVTYSNGIKLKRGGLTDTLITVGEIGGTNTNNNFYINGNGVNNIIIDSGIDSLLLYAKNFTVDNGGAGPMTLLTNVLIIGSEILKYSIVRCWRKQLGNAKYSIYWRS